MTFPVLFSATQSHPSKSRPAARLLRASLLGGTALALLIGAGSGGAWAQTASGTNSTAYGAGSEASGTNSTAYGKDSKAYGTNSTASGASSEATSTNSTAYGKDSLAYHDYSTVMGYASAAVGTYSTAMGAESIAYLDYSIAMGSDALAYGKSSLALGAHAKAGVYRGTQINDVALGSDSSATGGNSVALGYGAQAPTGNSVALGANSVTGDVHAVTGSYAGLNPVSVVSVGGLYNGAVVTRQIQNVAAGLVSADSTDAVNGSQLFATNQEVDALKSRVGTTNDPSSQTSTSLALGYGSKAAVDGSTGNDYATAVGVDSSATGQGSTAVGAGSSAAGAQSIATGFNSIANGAGSAAFGSFARTDGDNATALGANSYATADSVALGANSTTIAPGGVASGINQAGLTSDYAKSSYAGLSPVGVVSVGGDERFDADGNSLGFATRQIQNVAAGSLSATSTDAVNGSQLFATNTRIDSFLGTTIGANGLALGMGSVAGSEDVLLFNPNSYATALGVVSSATGQGSTAVGYNSSASKNYATAIGSRSKADGSNSSAFGGSAWAIADNATALGANSYATADSVALGANSTTIAPGGVASGINQAGLTSDYAKSSYAGLSPVGVVSVGGDERFDADGNSLGFATRQIQNVAAGSLSATSTDAVNGSQLFATNERLGTVETNITSINTNLSGLFGTTIGANGLALGMGSVAGSEDVLLSNPNSYATALGVISSATGQGSTAVGYNSSASATGSTAIGSGSSASGQFATVAGIGSSASGQYATAMGAGSAAYGDYATAIGLSSSAAATDSVAAGNVATAYGVNSIALGARALAGVEAGSAVNDIALGADSSATGGNSLALGYGAKASAANSVALGAESVTDNPHSSTNAADYGFGSPYGALAIGVVSVGKPGAERQIQNVAAGLVSATSTDAVNGSQLYATNQAIGDVNNRMGAVLSGSDVSVAGAGETVRKIVGVANGAVGASSTDAVNGSQLKATNDSVDAVNSRVTAVSDRVTVVEGTLQALTSAVGGFKAGTASGVNALALGAGSSAGANSVALGAGSATGSVHKGPEATSVNLVGTASTFAGAAKDSSGLVSVGASGAERQIQNVAAGLVTVNSTDAVNGSQLYAAYSAIGTLDTTLNGVTRRLGSETGGSSSSAYGAGSLASAGNATAIGANANASAANSVALGANSVAAETHSSANAADYGFSGAAATAAKGVVSVGSAKNERQIQNVAAGMVTSSSTDAVNGSQLYATNQAIDRTNQSVAALGQSLGALGTSVNQLSARQIAAQKEARGGVAAAVALVNAPMPSAPGKTSWAGNVAKFRDQYAMGFSFAHRLNSNMPLAMTAGFAYTPGTSDVTGRFGMAGEF